MSAGAPGATGGRDASTPSAGEPAGAVPSAPPGGPKRAVNQKREPRPGSLSTPTSPRSSASAATKTSPASVNFTAFETRFRRTCRSRPGSPRTGSRRAGAALVRSAIRFSSAACATTATASSRTRAGEKSIASGISASLAASATSWRSARARRSHASAAAGSAVVTGSLGGTFPSRPRRIPDRAPSGEPRRRGAFRPPP
jgi:hypothetical protein